MQQDHNVVIFESNHKLGGAFATAYHGAILTSSNVITAFSSFPPTEKEAKHWTAGEYCQYLERYANANQIIPHIRFRTYVQRVFKSDDGKWIVRSQSSEQKSTISESFDSVCVCCGSHQTPSLPQALKNKFKGFKGDVIHSTQYRCDSQLRGKRVVIIGLGESGSDIAFQASRVAKRVCISTRNGGGYIIPRKFGNLPTDLDTSRAHHLVHQGRLGWR